MTSKVAAVLMSMAVVASMASGQAPAPQPQPPTPAPAPQPAEELAKAVVTLFNDEPVPDTWRQGFSIPLKSDRSVAGGKPQSVRWTIDPPEYDRFSPRRDNGRSIDVQTGVEPVLLTIKLAVAKGDTFDETIVRVKVGSPKPPAPPVPPTPAPVDPPAPTPAPGPAPQPQPDSAFVVPKIKAAASEYFKGFAKDYADAASRTRISPQPYNDLVKAQAAAKSLRAKALAEAVDAVVVPQVDEKTGLFISRDAAGYALQAVAESLKAGMTEAAK